MSRFRSTSAARSRSSSRPRSDEAPPRREVETASPEEVAAAVIAPLRERVVAGEEFGSELDRRFRRELDEILEDISSGMTPHTAGRAVGALDPGVEQWFDRMAEAHKARNGELSRVIEVMGKALKTIQGDDAEFLGGLDQSLDRLRKAADGVQVRHVSARLAQIVEATTEQAAVERKARDNRVKSLSQMVRGLHEQLDVAKIQLQEDALTGLYNRRTFDDRLEAELEKCRLAPYSFALIMIDLDHFKSVNDQFGHVGGDRVLQACAESVKAVVLRSNDFCARYGGEEMAVILSDCDMENGRKVADAIRTRIASEEIPTGTAKHRQTASFGVSEGCDDDSAVDVIERADAALYAAKESGRNKVVVAGHGEARRVRLPSCQTGGRGGPQKR